MKSKVWSVIAGQSGILEITRASSFILHPSSFKLFFLLISFFCLQPPAYAGTHVNGVYSVGASPAVMATVNGNAEYGLVFAQRNKSITYNNVLYVNNVVTAYFDLNGNLNDGNGNLWIDLVPNANATPADSYYVVTINIQGAVHSEIWIVPDQTSVSVLSVRQATAPSSRGTSPPVLFYQTVQQTGANLAQRPTLNFTGTGISCLDNSGLARTDCTFTSSSGTGTVTSFSAGTLSPLFTSSVATATTTPALSFTLSNAAAHQFFGNNTGGSAAPTFVQPAFTDISGSLAASQLPNPSATMLGGIQSLAAVGSKWINTISTSGVPSATQPAFTDLSGTLAASQLPNPSATTLGGIESLVAVSHKWINTISTLGVPSATQPASSDLSDAANLVTTSTTATGDLSGAYPGPSVAKINGTSIPTNAAADQTIVTTASATGAWKAVNNCGDATHALSYSTGTHAFGCQAITATATAGGSSGQVQWNNSTALAGMSNLTTTGTVTTALSGADWLFADPTDSTKKAQFDLSGITTATTRTVTVANANSTTVVADTGAANNFLTAISATGAISKAQPAFTNILGTVAAGQLPNPSATTLGGIQSLAAASHKWINTISTSGVPSATQPDYSDLTGAPTLYNQTVQANGTAQTQRPIVNLISGSNATVSCVDNAGATRTDCTIAASASSGMTNPMTTLGDIIYENSTPAAARLAGQITTTKEYLSQTGNGSISAIPVWAQVAYGDLSGTPTLPSTLANVSHKWINSYTSSTGLFTQTQPDYSDLTGVPSTFTPAAHNLLSSAHGDTTASAAVRGGAIFAVGASPLWTQVAHSAATGGYWKWNGTDVVASTGAASGTGTPTACTNQAVTGFTLAADAAPTSTCSTITSAFTSGTFTPSAHNLLSASHGDTTVGTVARGDVITGQGASPTWTRLAKGTASQCLQMDGTATDVIWGACATGGSGITTLNTLSAATQTFATGTSGTDFNISSATSTHTFNIPDAGAGARGLVTTGTQTIAGAKTFSSALAISASSGNTLVANTNDLVVDSTDHRVGIGTASPIMALDINKTVTGGDVNFELSNTSTSGNARSEFRVAAGSSATPSSNPNVDFLVLSDTYTGTPRLGEMLGWGLADFYVGTGDSTSGGNLDFFVGGAIKAHFVGSTGHLIWNSDNTNDIGASGATRPRTGYFGTSLIAPTINATTGFQVNGAAAATNVLVGNGTNFVAGQVKSTQVDSSITGFSASNTSANAMASAATDTQLVEFSLPAGYLNTANKVVNVRASGTWAVGTTQTPTWNFKLKLCSVSGCGSGTVLSLLSWTSAASTASTTQTWLIEGDIGTTATGASGTVIAHGQGDLPVGSSSGTLPAATTHDANTTVSSAIDLTAALYVDIMANVSTQSGTKNSCTYQVARLRP